MDVFKNKYLSLWKEFDPTIGLFSNSTSNAFSLMDLKIEKAASLYARCTMIKTVLPPKTKIILLKEDAIKKHRTKSTWPIPSAVYIDMYSFEFTTPFISIAERIRHLEGYNDCPNKVCKASDLARNFGEMQLQRAYPGDIEPITSVSHFTDGVFQLNPEEKAQELARRGCNNFWDHMPWDADDEETLTDHFIAHPIHFDVPNQDFAERWVRLYQDCSIDIRSRHVETLITQYFSSGDPPSAKEFKLFNYYFLKILMSRIPSHQEFCNIDQFYCILDCLCIRTYPHRVDIVNKEQLEFHDLGKIMDIFFNNNEILIFSTLIFRLFREIFRLMKSVKMVAISLLEEFFSRLTKEWHLGPIDRFIPTIDYENLVFCYFLKDGALPLWATKVEQIASIEGSRIYVELNYNQHRNHQRKLISHHDKVRQILAYILFFIRYFTYRQKYNITDPLVCSQQLLALDYSTLAPCWASKQLHDRRYATSLDDFIPDMHAQLREHISYRLLRGCVISGLEKADISSVPTEPFNEPTVEYGSIKPRPEDEQENHLQKVTSVETV